MTDEIVLYTNPMRFGYVEERPAFAKYWALVSDRDAYRRATEIDDALMPKST